MRRTAAVFLMTFLVAAAAGTLLVRLGKANPYSQAQYKGTIAPPSRPTITISSPENNTSHKTTNLTIILNVTIAKTTVENYDEFISRVYYTADWQQNETYIYKYYNPDPSHILPKISEFSHSLNLTEIPEGKHNLTFHAVERGYYYASFFEYYGFSANVSSQLSFTVDTISPNVTIMPMNETLGADNVPLHYAVDESAARIAYSLDGQENMTVFGNFTLPALSFGEHNVTVYAWDAAGNVEASETSSFTVTEPESFPTVPVLAASAISIAAVTAAGLVLTRRKRRREAQQT
ncbi:MAG TPA: hypothetical protein VF893_06140 [Candidatus Bathyarchaeia archaeon]